MSRFNVSKQNAAMEKSYEGAVLYGKNLEEDWINNLFSNMCAEGFYESAEDRLQSYVELTKQILDKYGPVFVAKAACFVRDKLGMRSISEYTAAILNDYKFDTKRDGFKNCFRRPDGGGLCGHRRTWLQAFSCPCSWSRGLPVLSWRISDFQVQDGGQGVQSL